MDDLHECVQEHQVPVDGAGQVYQVDRLDGVTGAVDQVESVDGRDGGCKCGGNECGCDVGLFTDGCASGSCLTDGPW